MPSSAVTSRDGLGSRTNVSSTVSVQATVTIVGGLLLPAGVQFKVDGVDIGAEDTTSPYSVSWNTRTVGNGSHTLTAVARSTLGLKFTSNPVTVTTSNDFTAPTVTINQATGQADPTNLSPIRFTVVFSESVSDFANGDVAIGGTAGGTKSVGQQEEQVAAL